MVTRIRAVVVPPALAGLIALAGVVLGRIYADTLLTQLVAGAAAGSVAAGVAARRLPSWTVAPLSVLLLAGYTMLSLRLAAGRADLAEIGEVGCAAGRRPHGADPGQVRHRRRAERRGRRDGRLQGQ